MRFKKSKYIDGSADGLLGDPVDYSSNWDVFSASVGEMVDENLSISGFIHTTMPQWERNSEIRYAIDNGELPDGYIDKFVKKKPGAGTLHDWNAMAKHANERFGTSFKTDAELIQDRNRELDIRRRYREDVFARAPEYGTAVQLAGGFAGAALDPINVAAAFVPIGYGINGLSRAAYTRSMVAKGATLGVLSAAAVEPFIYNWKNEIGSEYRWEDAAFNMIASGVLEGGIGGLSGSIYHRFDAKKPPRMKADSAPSHEEKVSKIFQDVGIEKVDADNVARTLTEYDNAPDSKMDVGEFTDTIEGTQDRMDVGAATDKEPDVDIDNLSQAKAVEGEEPDTSHLVQEYIDGDGNTVKYDDALTDMDDRQNSMLRFVECMI